MEIRKTSYGASTEPVQKTFCVSNPTFVWYVKGERGTRSLVGLCVCVNARESSKTTAGRDRLQLFSDGQLEGIDEKERAREGGKRIDRAQLSTAE